MSEQDNYQPVSCATHSEYELAIMHGQQIELCWNENNQQYSARVTPLDLVTKDRQEFLLVRNNQGDEMKIRLDYIINFKVSD